MAQYRKKPIIVGAMQYEHGELQDLIDYFGGNSVADWKLNNDGIIIATLEGDHLARDGDWIIKGIAGEFYPCKPAIFDKTYEVIW